jgi:hypothetical protein
VRVEGEGVQEVGFEGEEGGVEGLVVGFAGQGGGVG